MSLYEPFENQPVITTERLILKPMELLDAPAMFEIKSDKEVTAKYGRESHKDMQQTTEWIKLILDNYTEKSSLAWTIFLKKSEKGIGSVILWNLDLDSQVGEIGYELHRDCWRHGFMFEALGAMTDWAILDMGLNRVEACPLKENAASIAVLEKLGFKFEGNLKERIYFRNRYWDQLYYAMLKSDRTKVRRVGKQ